MIVRPSRRAAPSGEVRRDQIVLGRQSGLIAEPGLRIPVPLDTTRNLFERTRPGRPVVRPEDFVAFRVEWRNMTLLPGGPPTLKPSGQGVAYLILHMPPQSITELAVFEQNPLGFVNDPPEGAEAQYDTGGRSDPLPEPPIRARAADESRLVFRVPAEREIPFTLEGVLSAVEELGMRVSPAAKPRSGRFLGSLKLDRVFQAAELARLPASRRVELAGVAARGLTLAGVGDEATMRRRAIAPGPGLTDAQLLPGPAVDAGRLTLRPTRPSKPGATTTAIEMPWRLIVSPHPGARWRHAKAPVTSPEGRTELWHTRLVTPRSDGAIVEPPAPDPNRTIRAVWAKLAEHDGSKSRMEPTFASEHLVPDGTDGKPPSAPFRTALSDFDRVQLAHLTSNWSITDYTPDPVDTNLMMLTALGGWLDSRGGWEPPLGLSVEEWIHRATMGRDHYVRIVYKGALFPLGHRVALVKETQRKFHGETANRAYLRTRYFLVVRDRERRYDNPALRDGNANLTLQLPFSRVRFLTEVTPNLDPPIAHQVSDFAQTMFWPFVNGHPFRFQCVGIDLDGRRIAFEMPMIFIDATVAAPGNPDDDITFFKDAARNAERARDAFDATRFEGVHLSEVNLRGQRVALAASKKSGDTSVEVETMRFSGFAKVNNPSLEAASDKLRQPIWTPIMQWATARLGPVRHLSGSKAASTLRWNATYLEKGFAQKGEVFVDIDQAGAASLDFSTQADRSGGFVQPNMVPKALSRIGGPITADVGKYIDGTFEKAGGFPTTDSVGAVPMPLLFGCIPLGAIIDEIANLDANQDKVPKFVQEAGNTIESFVDALARGHQLVAGIAAESAGIGRAAVGVFRGALGDFVARAAGLTAGQQAPLVAALNGLDAALQTLATRLDGLVTARLASGAAAPDLADLPSLAAQARGAADALISAANAVPAGQAIPAGLRQDILAMAARTKALSSNLEQLPALVAAGKTLFDALDAIVGDPAGLADLLQDGPTLQSRVNAVADAIGVFNTALGALTLLDGAPRKRLVGTLGAIEEALALAATIAGLFGDELTIRFDWSPEISSYRPSAPIFRANDKRGFFVAVEAKVKKDGSSSPKVSVLCGLKHFDLVLIAPASFIELSFEKILFSVDSKAKMDVDVVFNDIKFVGPLSFVETLRDLIPLDGFSDPPCLDITPQGIDAGFNVALPGVTVGVMNLQNLSLGAGCTVPFIGQPLAVRFNFCTREQPFLLTVYAFGGGGFFGITIDPSGVQILEAAFEFGASLSVNLGVASGGVEVMAGIYFRMEKDDASLTGYFCLGGHVSVLGLISASIELYLELSYEFPSGKCVGKAQLTIEISVFVFSGSVTITCERKFAGSNGDPNLREMLGHRPDLSLADELDAIGEPTAYAWREHCEAFG